MNGKLALLIIVSVLAFNVIIVILHIIRARYRRRREEPPPPTKTLPPNPLNRNRYPEKGNHDRP
jgi:hypothetical protein